MRIMADDALQGPVGAGRVNEQKLYMAATAYLRARVALDQRGRVVGVTAATGSGVAASWTMAGFAADTGLDPGAIDAR